MGEITDLKVEMATMRSDMKHLVGSIHELQKALETAMPRREVIDIETRFEKRVAAMETSFTSRISPLESKVDTVIATIAAATNKGSGAMWAVNGIWAIVLVVFGIYMKLSGK